MVQRFKKNYFLFLFIFFNLIITLLLSKKNKIYNQKSILIIFVNAIGDFVLFSSVLDGIKNYYKDYEITIFGFNRWQNLAENIPYLNYIPFNRNKLYKNPFYLFRTLFELKKQSFSIAIYPSYSRTSLGDLLMKACIARDKIAYNGDNNNISKNEKLRNNEKIYTELIPKPKNIKKEIEFYRYFASQIGIDIPETSLPFIWTNDKDRSIATSLLSKAGLKKDSNYIVIAPGAGSPIRIWDLSKFAEVCIYLYKQGYQLVFTGSKREKHLVQSITNYLSFPIIDLTGKTTLTVMAEIYRGASLYFGNDSGSVHIAISVNTPTVCLLGGGHPFRFYPYGDINMHRVVYKKKDCYGCNWNCIFNEAKCISEITPSQVIKEINILLDNIIIGKG